MANIAKHTSDVIDVIDATKAAEKAAKGCPTPIEEMMDKMSEADMYSGDNSQVPATTTKPESIIGDYANRPEFWVGGK
ncbi:MAG: hypothetical protein ACC651_08110 [Candidatus Scalindua sp.]